MSGELSGSRASLIVAFNHRSGFDKARAFTRVRTGPAMLEGIGTVSRPFFWDKKAIESTLAWRRLQALCQYRPGTHFSVQERMAHTIAAKNIGETICDALGLDQHSADLVKAITTAHDVGHPPLAHYGERGISAAVEKYGFKWDHDVAVLRVLCEWTRYHGHAPGLDLTLDTVEGIAKRYWRFVEGEADSENRYEHSREDLPACILELDDRYGLYLDRFSHIEGQIACISDWIAFTATDIEDGLRIGEFTIEMICEEVPFVAEIVARLPRGHGGKVVIDPSLLRQEIEAYLIQDVLAQTRANIDAAVKSGQLKAAEDVRTLDHLLVTFSPPVFEAVNDVTEYHIKKDPAHEDRLYEDMVEQMFDALMSGEIEMTGEWKSGFDQLADHRHRLPEYVCMYMTRVITDQDVFDFAREYRPDLYVRHMEEARPSGKASLVPAVNLVVE